MNEPVAPTIGPFGDAALLVRFGERIDPALNARVHALAAVVRQAAYARPALRQPVAGYASLLVPFDPLATSADELADWLHEESSALAFTEPATHEEPIEVPVRYGGEDGPDLAEVARRTGLTEQRVVDLHSSVIYRAYMLGFAPGFAYLGELPRELELPRRGTPRQRVPPGSVAIAARQTAIYPFATPGGWHIIGRTDSTTWDIGREPPALIHPGAAVRFVLA